ncbi:hypothetical protein HanIR_Chr15g0779641 [Helianthus annuus]|nr:hypothetical protein HanIR_Chr15g0779641 [Helianthus annuus]
MQQKFLVLQSIVVLLGRFIMFYLLNSVMEIGHAGWLVSSVIRNKHSRLVRPFDNVMFQK